MSIYYSSLCFVAADNPAHAAALLREKWQANDVGRNHCWELFEPGQPREFRLIPRGNDSLDGGEDAQDFIEQLYQWEETNGHGVIPVSSGDHSTPSSVSDSSRCDESLCTAIEQPASEMTP